MNERALWPGNVAAGAVLIGGILLVAFPRHALSIVQLVVMTIAAGAAIYVLAVNVPTAGWISPFKWLSPFSLTAHPDRLGHRSDELELIRGKLSSRRQKLEDGPAMPPAVLRQLKPLIAAALDVDVRDEKQLRTARARLSRVSYAVLTAHPLERTSWFNTVPGDEVEVVRTVHQVLDDLDRLSTGGHPTPMSPAIRA